MNKKILFIDLDDTLIKTVSGKTFPEDVTDFRIRKDVLDKIRTMNSFRYIFIVTNQGGIGEFVDRYDFETKLESVKKFVSGYCRVTTLALYCSSLDKNDPMRKPNTGMLERVWSYLGLRFDKSEALMVGDASGKPGDYSDSDKKTAENFGIDYVDVEDFVNGDKY